MQQSPWLAENSLARLKYCILTGASNVKVIGLIPWEYM